MVDLSYSQIDSWLTCAERYRLERLEKVPTPPTWPLVGGRAVHVATELVDRDTWGMKHDDPGVAAAWHATFNVVMDEAADEDATGTPPSQWRTSRGHGQEWWSDNGARMVANWVRTRQERDWHLFADDPALGVELYVDGFYGDNRVRGYIDRLLMTPDGEPFVCDIKTGEKAPLFPMQLGIYADLLRRGPQQVQVAGGNYFMAGKGEPTPMLDL